MIQIARVRKAPRTGLGNHQRKNTAVVYLKQEWYKEKVIVIPFRQYRNLLHQIKAKSYRLQIQILKDKLARIRKITS